jgi:hypothetical protein
MLAVSSSQFEPGPTLDWQVTNKDFCRPLLHVGKYCRPFIDRMK